MTTLLDTSEQGLRPTSEQRLEALVTDLEAVCARWGSTSTLAQMVVTEVREAIADNAPAQSHPHRGH
ncbi:MULTISPECIES: hypothetical protein [unclassified Microbacterium]|uniref:hypothetical protein n=1 Tax=unclassified Microbacterium TaxID=2609290 RepID=UPI0010F66D3D|nr:MULTISPECIES: hypothetical protein [unclassified Microbacterium]